MDFWNLHLCYPPTQGCAALSCTRHLQEGGNIRVTRIITPGHGCPLHVWNGGREALRGVRQQPHPQLSCVLSAWLPCSYLLILENYLCFSFTTTGISSPKKLFFPTPGEKNALGFPSPWSWTEHPPGLALALCCLSPAHTLCQALSSLPSRGGEWQHQTHSREQPLQGRCLHPGP